MQLSPGDTVPDFTLPLADGGTVSRASLAGRAAVVYFYPKDDTPGCTVEARDFSCLASEFAAIGVPVIGVSPDSVEKHKKFAKKHDLTLALAADPTTETLAAFGVWAEKSMYGRSYMGVERTTVLIGADGRVARIWPKVKVAGHATEVLEAARALVAGTPA